MVEEEKTPLLVTLHSKQALHGYKVKVCFGTHPESCLHLGLEDVTLEMIREQSRGGRRVQRLLRQLLLLSLPGEQGGR